MNNKNIQSVKNNKIDISKNYTFFIPKHLLTHDVIKKQKILFNRLKFGNLKFYFKITYKTTNVFFIFFCKAEKYPTKVFNFFKQSTGIENRDKIRQRKVPHVNLRGRKKVQFQTIKNKLNLVKSYIHDFIKVHPEMAAYKRIYMIWSIYYLDFKLQSLLNQSFEFSYSINVLERVIKEKVKDEVLYQLNLRPRLNLTDHEIIYKFYNRNKYSNISEDFIFKSSKKKKALDLRSELIKAFKELPLEDKKLKLKTLIKYQYKFKDSLEDVLHYSHNIYLTNLKNFVLGYTTQKSNKNENIENNVKLLNTIDKSIKPKTRLDQKIDHYLELLEKKIEIDSDLIDAEQLVVIHKFNFKFPHNGCRPKKARRLKRTNK